MAEENAVQSTVALVKGVAEAVPVYQDALQPGIKKAGQIIGNIMGALAVLSEPFARWAIRHEHRMSQLRESLLVKAESIPAEYMQPPPLNIVGPVLESVRFHMEADELREMYAHLLASAMDSRIAAGAHPAFVDALKQMCPDEAKILRLLAVKGDQALISLKAVIDERDTWNYVMRFISNIGREAGAENNHLSPVYLMNLVRLNLVEVTLDAYLNLPPLYEALEHEPTVQKLIEDIKTAGHQPRVEKGFAGLTVFGRQFCHVCLPFEEPKANLG